MKFDEIHWNMNICLEEAEKAYKLGEVPVGALLVDKDGNELARAHNLKEATNNPIGHAEILAIQEASKNISSWRLNSSTLYVTLEPCSMCLGAMIQARISNLVFGAYDTKSGALSLGYNFYKDNRLNHRFNVFGGVHHFECSSLLSNFFKQKRKFHG